MKKLMYKYTLINKDNKTLCIFPDKPFWFVGDNSIEPLMSYFSEKISSEELASKLIEHHSYTDSEVKDMKSYLEQLFQNANLFKKDDSMKLDPLSVKDVFAIPVLNITKQCNLRCKHCYADADYVEICNSNNELSTEQWKSLIDEIIELVSERGEDRILLTGGEPFLRSDIMEIIHHIYEKGFRPLVNTNALLIKESDMNTLNHYKAELLVSLDGASKEKHEFLRGKDTFEETYRKIKLLKKYNVTTRLSFTINSFNFDEIKEFIELAQDLKINEIALNNLTVLSRANCSKLKRIDTTTINSALKEISEMEHIDKKYLSSTDFANLGAILLENIKFLYCGVGAASLCIDSNGDVYPCYNTMTDEFKVGNVLETSIIDLWKESPLLNSLRNLCVDTMNNQCSKCIVRYYCGGGCRGETYFLTNDINAPYPFCQDSRKAIIDMMFTANRNNSLFNERVGYFNRLKNKFVIEAGN